MASQPAGKRLVIVSEFVDATQNSTGYYWSKIIDGLSSAINDMYVVCTESSYARLATPCSKVSYIVVKNTNLPKHLLITRLLGQLQQAYYLSQGLKKITREGDVVFSGTNPALMLLSFSWLKKQLRFKWILLAHDVFPDNLIAAKILSKGNYIYRALNALFCKIYQTADTIIAIGRDMVDLLQSKTNTRVVYIPNWVDLTDIQPATRPYKNTTDSKIVFQFFGNLGRMQGIGNLLEAIAQVTHLKASFVFIGDGAQRKQIQSFILAHPALNVVLKSSVPFAKNSEMLRECDVALVTLAPGMNGLGVPSKAYFSMAADKPILVVTDADSELHLLLKEEPHIGWFCPAGDATRLAGLIDQICEQRLLGATGSPRLTVASRYSYPSAIEKYSQLL